VDIQTKVMDEARVLASAAGQMAQIQFLCPDVRVKGHQESNLKPGSEDRMPPLEHKHFIMFSTSFLPTVLLYLYDRRLPIIWLYAPGIPRALSF
jgi:hypothetical protein